MDKVLERDVVIIGGGCAGMLAALEARKEALLVTIIDSGSLGLGTNSALSGALFSCPNSHYEKENYIRDTLQTGRGLNHEPLVKTMAQQASRAFSELGTYGIEIVERTGGFTIKSPGNDFTRGVTMVKALSRAIRNTKRIEVLTGLQVTELLKADGQAHGVKGFDRSGADILIYSKATVLATGGAGAIYLRSDNQNRAFGQGYWLAAKTGIELMDMEFVQFYPFVLAEPRLPRLIIYGPYPPGLRLTNGKNEDILQKYGLTDLYEAIKTQRDELSVALFRETSKGNIFIDYRRVPDSFWDKHPFRRLRFDFKNRPACISPAAHFFMGGIPINEKCETSLDGLFACGEVTGGIHGANRMQGNSLTECVVFGQIAGFSAASHAGKQRVHRINQQNDPTGEMKHVLHKWKPQLLLKQLREIAWRHAGVIRTEHVLRNGLERVMEVERDLGEISALNTKKQKETKENFRSAAFTLKAVLTASLARCESRGAFIRIDYPEKADIQWRKNSHLSYQHGKNEISVDFKTMP